MINLFKKKDAKAFVKKHAFLPGALALRIYTSRLIGANSDLVLHGGGNTSVKLMSKNILGEKKDVIFVKGSGMDLSTIGPDGFVGLNMEPLRRLRNVKDLADEVMQNQLRIHRIDASAPDPSVEALLHIFLPHTYIDHTHADSILILTNQKNGKRIVKEALGDKVPVISYILSGLPLAKAMINQYKKNPDIEAIVVMNHGIFTFADSAETSYKNMVAYVSKAETYIKEQTKSKLFYTPSGARISREKSPSAIQRAAQVIRGTCAHGQDKNTGKLRKFCIEIRDGRDLIEASLSKEAKEICRSGVLTPDHAIRTKNEMAYIPSMPADDAALKQLVHRVVHAYKKDYRQYVQSRKTTKNIDFESLDPYPRLFLVFGAGLIAIGFSRKDARIAADIGEHTIRAKRKALTFGEYKPISRSHVFDMEYWSLQQQKLKKSAILPLQGQIALVTGAAGAIGAGVAERLLAAGAVVVISDIDKKRLEIVYSILTEKYNKNLLECEIFDVTDFKSVQNGFNRICQKTGGIDIVVPNAGVAHVAKIEDMDPQKFDQVMAVNLKGTYTVIKAAIPVFRRQGTGGNIIVISSKNVFDPGAAFGAYSASKAGAHQISKIAALELAEMGVRVNMVNPDAVFGDDKIPSKLWGVVGPDRMKSRGLDPEGLQNYYQQRNLLKTRVLAEHVGNAVVFFASDLTPTTGAALPVDGGNPATFSR
ncbi:MAG: bifunctional aldolase/short-chain dehydrogenase [Deltaproteobacteria bacterium]|nr:bifunctional aldolase/short-chain dehydrogenase [Deltaproteobacteria bacterium]